MSFTIKDIKVTYNAINEKNTFTSGDFISGQVTVEVAKTAEIQSLLVKAKGKANVMWTERHGQTTVVYHDKEKYFSLEQFLIREGQNKDSNVIPPGTHVYPFTFQIPQQNMPASFKGSVGKVVYSLETKLSRSMRVSNKAKTEFAYVPKPDLTIPDLMLPQYGTKDKKMRVFTSGSVSISTNMEKMGYYLGEGLKVMAEVHNNSSRAVKLKYSFYVKHSFFARGRRRVHTHEILKEQGEPIEPSTQRNVTRVLNIPPDIMTSILNCRILKVEYRLRVYLDVPYASDPEIKFPVVILPLGPDMSNMVPPNPDMNMMPPPPPYSEVGFGPYYGPNQPGWNSSPYPAPPSINPYQNTSEQWRCGLSDLPTHSRRVPMTTVQACRQLPAFTGLGCHDDSPLDSPHVSGRGIQLTNPLPVGELQGKGTAADLRDQNLKRTTLQSLQL
ncbi:arrestin domain-containing protein 3-like [Chanos chanos]|uniref:Arrestin domain-containing protein 3-like n=1 Tax=Chanos chanos TaxID=29144 RepID=A0A6J2WTW7_CHACN|nr:arrestin domain-containing protein 3-like [Chanos chanos]